jgi:Protein of unknown function (DUF2581).
MDVSGRAAMLPGQTFGWGRRRAMTRQSEAEAAERRFHFDRGRYGAGFFGGLLAVLLALRALATLATDAALGAYALLDVGLAVGVIAMAAFAWRMADRRPALVVGPTGVAAPRLISGTVPWSDVRSARLRVSHLRTLRLATLEIVVRDREEPLRIELLKLADGEQKVLAAVDRYKLVERPRALGAPPPDAEAAE